MSITTNYNTLSLDVLVKNRADILRDINQQVESLNQQFRKDPKHLSAETINGLFENLKAINTSLENKKNSLLHKDQCTALQQTPCLTWTTMGLDFTAWLIAAVVAGIGVNANDENDKPRSLAIVVVTILGIFITAVLASAIRAIDQNRSQAELMLRLSEIQDQGKEMRDFIRSFCEFQAMKEDEEKQRQLTLCVSYFDRLPQDGYKKDIPSRDHWVSALIQMLPETNPIKIKLYELGKYNTARPSHQIEDEERDPGFRSPRKKKKNTFTGEQFSLQMAQAGPQSLGKGSKFKKGWTEIEEMLGFQINYIQLEDVALDRNGGTADTIEGLGALDIPTPHEVIEITPKDKD